MNPTITKLVNLLFEDIEETEDIRLIHDEVMNNCQERYSDLVQSGLSAEDATQAVVESLKGMEEMLAEYPHKNKACEGIQNAFCFDPSLSPVRAIHALHLGGADLIVRPSPDSYVHIRCEDNLCTMRTQLNDGVLVLEPVKYEFHHESHSEERHVKADFSFDLSDVSGFLSRLASKLSSVFLSGTIKLLIPEGLAPELKIDSSSGDIHADSIRLQSLHITTVAGDVHLSDVEVCGEVHMTATAGDLSADGLSADSIHLGTTSGDIFCSGNCKVLDIRTIAGDVHAIPGASVQSLHGKSTAGDLYVELKPEVQAQIVCRTAAGDISQHVPSCPGAPVLVDLHTIAGDISVR